ncbi:MAG: IS200/IS605 family accessory protein TnpB-related protein [Bacillota bacterium]
MKDVNHKVSKAIVEFARQFPNPVIKLEDLTGIRDSRMSVEYTDRNLHSWHFTS